MIVNKKERKHCQDEFNETENNVNGRYLGEEEYEKCKNVVLFCKAKFERTEQGFLHFYNYLQFNNKITMQIVKSIFNKDKGIIFPQGILPKGASKENFDYIEKLFKKCKIHHYLSKGKYCKCNFFNLNDLKNCKICTIECCRQQRKKQLNEEGSENYEKQKAIIDNNYSYKDVITNRSKWPTSFASTPQNLEKQHEMKKNSKK
ncbi:39540_t:CDS:2 [Gigaspora margarita]|uniref:39540_t:CDS:1 n=1 Tax=Gigaspora margarita TaxID=4874 RepID=A0ABN7VD51_GIGMA|nr:39540_t:CDS:2 [Gigaspora margarita]